MPADTVTGKTTILITGAKTGIGHGLLSTYALRPNTIVIAAIRDGPHSTPGEHLRSLPVGPGSKIIVAKYDAADPKAALEMARHLTSRHDIIQIDTLIANAGVLSHFGPMRDVKVEELQEHWNVNTLAPVLLYQAFRELLEKAEKPKLFIVSSKLGSNAFQDDWDYCFGAYGMSKAAVNFGAGRIHREEERIAVVVVHPGWVKTGMGEQAAHYIGAEPKEVPVSVEESVEGLVKVFDAVTKEEHSGNFYDQEGRIIPW